MSGELLAEPGVLAPGPVVEVHGWRHAAGRGGAAVCPWRADALAAQVGGVPVVASLAALDGPVAQVAVHAGRARAATMADCAEAWRILEPGGRLAVCGPNAVGIAATLRRLARAVGPALHQVGRAHARVAVFERDDGPGPPAPPDPAVELVLDGEVRRLASAPGVFSADRADPGSLQLLAHLATLEAPRRLCDLGCGIGVLGLAALLRWPDATGVLAEGDERAVACARANAAALGVAGRATLRWWDAAEPSPAEGCDLALLNPPCHAGAKAVDLAPARALFARAAQSLRTGGMLVAVANRRLPYERELSAYGAVRVARQENGFKILEVVRR